jgi:hypothetical protein
MNSTSLALMAKAAEYKSKQPLVCMAAAKKNRQYRDLDLRPIYKKTRSLLQKLTTYYLRLRSVHT